MVRRSPTTDRMFTVGVLGLMLLAGCRGLVVGGGSAAGYPQGPSPTPAAGEAPAACGFPPGTALSFAGRSTTAALDVQEVVGDPMSTEPADIYITRDAFDQGQHHGRLVCAIYVQDPTFVEITVASIGRWSGLLADARADGRSHAVPRVSRSTWPWPQAAPRCPMPGRGTSTWCGQSSFGSSIPGGNSMNGRMGCHGTDGSGPRSSRAAIGDSRSCSIMSTGPSSGASSTS